MSKTVIVVSTHVDITLREQLPMDKVMFYESIEELRDYVTSTPIRADIMYISRDVLGESVNTKLSYLMDMLKNPFLSVKEVVYVTEAASREILSVNFMIEENGYSNWTVMYGTLNREYLSSLISGTLRSEDVTPKRRAVVRVNRQDYLREKMKAGAPEAHYPSEEEEFSEVPSEDVDEPQITEVEKTCRIQTISGLEGQARSVFTLLFAQYLSYEGKVVVIEKDTDYLRLSNLMHSSGVNHMVVETGDLYRDPKLTIKRIRVSTEKLILITDKDRLNYDYSFIGNIIYNNLKNVIDFLVLEKDFNELSPTTKYVTVIPNNMPDILKTVEQLPAIYAGQTSFAVLNVMAYKEANLPNTKQVLTILKDLLQETELKLLILNVRSLKLGGEAHDLRMYVN